MFLVVTFSSSVVVMVSVSLLMYWSMSFLVDLLFSVVLAICVVIVLLMCFQFALWYSLIVFVGLGCSVPGSLNVAVIMLWSDPRSSSTKNSTNFFVSSGEENIRSFTSCLPVLSLVYVGSLSFSIVYLCALIVLISVRPLLSLFSCPMSSCLLLKSPVIIMFLCRRIMPSNISFDGFLCGQYIVAICICSCPVVISIECCRFVVGFVVFICSSVSVFMLFLCIIHIPCPVLSPGCVMVQLYIFVFGFIFSVSLIVMMSG